MPLALSMRSLARCAAAWSNDLIHQFLASQVFVAACATALAFESSQIAGVSFEPIWFYLFLFFATLTSYRLHAHVSHALAGTRIGRESGSRSLTVAAAVISGSLALQMNSVALLITGISGALAWLYSVPMWTGARRLREFGVMKILVLVGVWTLMTGVLPLVGKTDLGTIGILALRRFLFVFALCMAFDVRDVASDAGAGVRTLAVKLGVNESYRLIRLTLAAFALLSVLVPIGQPAEISPGITAALIGSALLTWLIVEATRGRRSSLMFLGGVDGMMLVQSALVCGVAFWIQP